MGFLRGIDTQFVIWIGIAALVVLALLLISNRFRNLAKYGLRAATGLAAMLVINLALGGFGLFVGINILTIAVVALLGLPGIVMLYGISFFV